MSGFAQCSVATATSGNLLDNKPRVRGRLVRWSLNSMVILERGALDDLFSSQEVVVVKLHLVGSNCEGPVREFLSCSVHGRKGAARVPLLVHDEHRCGQPESVTYLREGTVRF